jgi:hypothetical protein
MTYTHFFKLLAFLVLSISIFAYLQSYIEEGALISYLGLTVIFFALSTRPIALDKNFFGQFRSDRFTYYCSCGLLMLFFGQMF